MKIKAISILLICAVGLLTCTKELTPLGSAAFTIQNGGCEAPCEVSFAAPVGDGLRYRWDFGDNTASSEQSPKKMFASAGSYTVKLVVTGAGGSAISSQTVTVRQKVLPPTASFTLGNNGCTAPCTVNFTNTSQNVTTSTTYLWDFGYNGLTSTQTSPSQSYTVAGTYTVKLTATGPGGTSTPATQVVTIAAAPIATSRQYLTGVTFASMTLVKGGTFQMGDTRNEGDSDEKPVHQVTVSDFYMGQYEVTQRQWQAIMGSNPSSFTGCADCPVEQVSWDDVKVFLDKLNQQRPSGTPAFRLPTEAEGEYASGGGAITNRTRFGNGKDIANPAEINYNGSDYTGRPAYSVVGVNRGKPVQVGSFSPNGLGLYDLSGNLYEWCSDWYGSYSSGVQTNPTGPGSGTSRVIRGGSWSYSPQDCRVAFRNDYTPSSRYNFIGFRVVSQAQ